MSRRSIKPAARDRRIVEAVGVWFAAHAREAPWRILPRDPYRALVSEFMLQQTQVSRVVERFGRFVARFPTVAALAAASEDDVLAEWSGLGYYRRAKNLHAAARQIVSEFGGVVPREVDRLLSLPGVGRYTAGAVASIVFGDAAPIVDGNVARVLLRIDGRDVTAAKGMRWAWDRAEALVTLAAKPGAFNEGLMELGAVVCTPRSPRCGECPVQAQCRARAAGSQDRIPRPKPAPSRKAMFCATVIVEHRGRVLVERRGDIGMWAGLWQAPTLERPRRPSRKTVEVWIGAPVVRVERFSHGATHRQIEFDVWRAKGTVIRPGAVWHTRSRVRALGLSNAMKRILLGPPLG